MNTPERVRSNESGLPISHALPSLADIDSKTDAKTIATPQIGQYRIVRKIGEGGMGAVYEAVHAGIGQRAAIKVLHTHLSHEPKFIKRFVDEAKLVGMVGHPGLVKIYDFTQGMDGAQCIIMEFLDGESLWSRFNRQKGKNGLPGMAVNDVMQIARQVASALEAVHGRGIVHRDLKPDNIMVVRDPDTSTGERIKILDFGIAKLDEASGGVRNTTTGVAMGTPTYMAPEQIESRSPTDRLDVYALGCIVFELLAGVPPFVSESTGSLLRQHLIKPPPPLPAHVPQELQALVSEMLAKEPEQRPSMPGIVEQLDRMARGERRSTAQLTPLALPPPPVRSLRWVAAAVVLVALATLIFFGQRRPKALPLPVTDTTAKVELKKDPVAQIVPPKGEVPVETPPAVTGPAVVNTTTPKIKKTGGKGEPKGPAVGRPRFGDLPKLHKP